MQEEKRYDIDKENNSNNNEAKKDSDGVTEDDRVVKEQLSLILERLCEPSQEIVHSSLETLKDLIRTSNSSMTSISRPIKFLKDRIGFLKTLLDNLESDSNRRSLSDIISVLSMVYGEEGKMECLKYRFRGNQDDIGMWGHDYVRNLSTELMDYYDEKYSDKKETLKEDIQFTSCLDKVLEFFLRHNSEIDACDLCIHVERMDKIIDLLEEGNYERIVLYIVSCARFESYPENQRLLECAHRIYRMFGQEIGSLIIAIKIDNNKLIDEDFMSSRKSLVRRQMSFILSRQGLLPDCVRNGAYENGPDVDNVVLDILRNKGFSSRYLMLGKEFGIIEPKSPEDVYKTHLENVFMFQSLVNSNSNRTNLASIIVNGFINIGFLKDRCVFGNTDNDSNFLYGVKDSNLVTSIASIGLLRLWEVGNESYEILDKYLCSGDDMIKAGALLGMSIINCGIHSEEDSLFALLADNIDTDNTLLKISIIIGIGISYFKTKREDISALILPLVNNDSIEISCFSALTLGLVFAGSCDGEIVSTIVQYMLEHTPEYFKSPYTKFLCLGLGLLFLMRQDQSETVLETLKVVEGPLSQQSSTMVIICSYCSTGNVLKVQECLHLCNDHLESNIDDTHQSFAVLGVALISIGDDIGSEMALRTLGLLMHYGESGIKRAVPLAIAFLYANNPDVQVLDILNKYSHDHDPRVAISAIFSLGIVGMGTNNARISQMLHQLASYYYKDMDLLFFVRLSQGLVYAGKGLVSVSPFHNDKNLCSQSSVAGMLVVLVSMLSAKELIFGRYSLMVYYLVLCVYPRFLFTMDEDLNPLSVNVRVGQAVDVIGQAGKPKTIRGFQTHITPIILGHSDRAELVTEQYRLATPNLEGFVILEKNPDFQETGEY